MTQGFYEQLGVPPDADLQALREAYRRQVAKLERRLQRLRDAGGDTSSLEIARQQLDDAWAVLSVPERRQRYDAMLTVVEGDGQMPTDAAALWECVGADLVPPVLAAATRLLGAVTSLRIEPIGDVERVERRGSVVPPPAPTAVPPTAFTEAPTAFSEPPPESPREPAPAAAAAARVVGSPGVALAVPQPARPGLSADRVAALVESHGYSGPFLRAVRETMGITLEEMVEQTRISMRYLQAIEGDAHDRLPGVAFVRGYVRQIAQILQLDDEAVVEGYMRRLG